MLPFGDMKSCLDFLLPFKYPLMVLHPQKVISKAIKMNVILRASFPVMAENTCRQLYNRNLLIKILAVSTYMTDFFSKRLAANNF